MSAPGFDPDIVASASAAQREAADPRLHVFVEANAGSGKTRVLVDRVARLLLAGVPPERILCVTFTKAAAGEMQTRLFKKLGDWSVMDDAALGAELDTVSGDAAHDQAAARRLFARALETPGGLKIQTLHAYCESLLRRFPLEAGLPPGFAAQEDDAAARARAEAAATVYEAAEPGSEIARAIETVLAHAGASGLDALFGFAANKRHGFQAALERAGNVNGLIAEAARLLDVAPELTVSEAKAQGWTGADHGTLRACLTALSGGKKTDADSAARLAEAFNAASDEAAFDAYCGVILKAKDGMRKPGSIYTTAVGEACPALPALFGVDGTERARMEAALARVNAASAMALTRAGLVLAERFLAAYERRLRAERAVDFADLVVRAKALLTDSEARDWALYKLDRGLEHILVDEAQDTAPDQWAVIDALTEEFFAGEGGERDGAESALPRTLFCVGDEKQSIYGFQDADPRLFVAQGANLETRARGAGLAFARPALDVSFRSSAEVLAAVDLAFTGERAALETRAVEGAPETKFVAPEPDAALAFHAYAPHRAARTRAPGCVEIWPAIPRPTAPEETSIDLPVDRAPANSARNQLAMAVAQEIADMLARGDRVWDGPTARPVAPGDIIVLVRKRQGGLFEEIIRQLKRLGAPVAGADRMTLGEQMAVKDLLALARWALLPEDDLALAETLKAPFFHPVGGEPVIDDEALFALSRERGRRLWDRLRATSDPRFTEARAALDAARARIDRDAPYAFFARFLGERSSTGETRLARVYARLGEEARDPVEEFLSRALAHEREGAPSLVRFTARMSADATQIKREMEAGRGEVRVMTVHAAKGLEAPVVFLPDTTQAAKSRFKGLAEDDAAGLLWAPDMGSAPDILAARKLDADARDEAESARLLYVALTRARDRLVICGARHGRGEGRVDEASWHARLDAAWSGTGWAEADTALDGVAAAHGWDRGKARRFGETPPALGRSETDASGEIAPPGWALSDAPPEPRAPRVVAPSRLAEEETGGFAPASLSPLAPGGQARFMRGGLIHKLLQTLPDLPPERRAGSADRFLAAQAELSDAQRAEIARETLAVLDHPGFAAIFGPGSRAEVAVSGRAPGLPDGVTVNGQIDRLVITQEAVLIVDFKTNRPPPHDPADVPGVYLAQMAAYRALLAALHPGKLVRCALLWTDGPRLMELPSEMLDAALARTRG